MKRHDSNGTATPRSRGFTLIEMAVVLVILGLVAVLVIELLPGITERFRLDQTEVGLRETDQAIAGFAQANNRLPCPDADGDGDEDCGATEVGTVPFEALGLDGQPFDEARIPLRFGVYRNASASADLVTLTNLYEPTLPGSLDITTGTVSGCGGSSPPTITFGSITTPSQPLAAAGATGNVTVSNQLNELDFCQSLRNGINTADSTSEVHTLNTAAIAINPAYLLVSGGLADANGNAADSSFDGLNENLATVDFNSAAMGRNASYDDVVGTTSMQELEYRFSCGRNIGAVNALAVDAVVMQNLAIAAFNVNEAALVAIDAKWAGLKLAEASVALEVALLAIASAGLASANTEVILTKNGNTPALLLAIAVEASATAQLVIAAAGQTSAQSAYTSACTSQIQAAAAVTAAEAAAATALSRALQGDTAGGVN